MRIELQKAGKKYFREWVFRNVNTVIEPSDKIAITGPNGSGKSTLLKVLSGQLSPSQGTIVYEDNTIIPVENIYREITFTAPYIDLIDEFTLMELLEFHFAFKQPIHQHTTQSLLQLSGLEKQKNKAIKSFSSGMKQRVKLLTTIMSNNKIVILDEPTTNLDQAGVDWYLQLVESAKANKIIITGSNMEREYSYCNHVINIADYKKF